MRAVEALETLELLGSAQWGLVTAAQAQIAGLSKVRLARLTDEGILTRVRHGVYSLPSASYGAHQDLRAAWLATDPSRAPHERAEDPRPVVVSGESAAAVHGLGDLLPLRHEFTAPGRRQTSQADVRFRRGALEPHEIASVDGLLVTSVARTVGDLTRRSLDTDHLRGVLADALKLPGVNTTALAEALNPSAKRYGYSSGTTLLEALAPPVPGYLAELAKNLTAHLNPEASQELLNRVEVLVERSLDVPSRTDDGRRHGE